MSHRFWTLKRRATATAYFAVAVGAVIAKTADLGTGVALMMAGVFMIGKLMREAYPDEKPPHHPKKEPGTS